RMNQWLGLLMICLAGTSVSAQVISGKVENKQTGEPLAGAVISAAGKQVLSARDGRFSLEHNGAKAIIISMVGYKRDTIAISDNTTGLTISLTPLHNQLDDVVVTGT